MRNALCVLGPLVAVVVGLTHGSSASAAPSDLRKKLEEKAPRIRDRLKDVNQNSVAIGEITGPAQLDTNAGPNIVKTLGEVLTGLGVRVEKTATYSIKGSYRHVPDPLDRNLIVIRITLKLLDDQDNEINDFPLQVELARNDDIARTLGINGALSPGATGPKRNEEIQERIAKPQVRAEGTRIKTTMDSPYAVEILMLKNPEDKPRARPVQVRDGLPFVDLNPTELYEIRLHNESPFEAAVAITIDGLDQFAFSKDRNEKGEPRFSHVLVPSGGVTTVIGWHHTNDPKAADNVLRFLVTDYGAGSSSARKATGQIGVISVSFAAAWKKGERPVNEKGSVETGLGPPAKVDLIAVPREIGAVRDFITLRYDRTK